MYMSKYVKKMPKTKKSYEAEKGEIPNFFFTQP